MVKVIKYYLLLIPNYITVFHFKNKYLLIIKYKQKAHYLKVKTAYCLIFIQNRLVLILTYTKAWEVFILIKKTMFELLIKTYKKIKLVGTGFKVTTVKNFLTKMLVFKLGFSHSIYLKVHDNITYLCCQSVRVFLISNTLTNLINLSFLIKSLKLTDVYSGKGIFYYNEQFKLKPLKSK